MPLQAAEQTLSGSRLPRRLIGYPALEYLPRDTRRTAYPNNRQLPRSQ
jgi:hypothetical protein